MIEDNLSQQTNKTKRTFYIKKKLPDDQLKFSKNMSSLAGLDKYLMAPNQSMKPGSRDDRRKERERSKYQLNTSVSQKIPKQSEVFEQSDQSKLTEILERNPNEEEERKDVTMGPQLKMKKEYISFMIKTGQVSYDNVVVWNNGTAAIYYEWKRIESQRLQQNSIKDTNEERFFCHHEQNVIKPGERIRFVFSFISKITGVFNEEWELKCEPPCITHLPTLKLTGQAFIDDLQTDQRQEFQKQTKEKFSLKIVTEVIGDIMEEVKTPPPLPPNLDDPEQFKIEFEELNLKEQLYYSPEIKNFFESTFQELSQELKLNEKWNGDVQYLRHLLTQVDDDLEKELIQRKLDMWVKLAKKVPINRNPLFPTIKELMLNMVGNIPLYADDLRKELGMWEYTFKEPSNDDPTPEQIKQKNDEFNKMKANWLKNAKKKKWNEELEKEMIDDYRNKLGEKISNGFKDLAMTIENDGQLLSVGALLNPQWKWNVFRRTRLGRDYWDDWLRKKSIVDADIEGKKVALKIHLKLADRPDVYQLKQQFEEALLKEQEEDNKRQEEERLERERQAQEAAKKKGKPKQQQKQQKQEEVIQGIMFQLKKEKPKVRDLSHLDQASLQEYVEIIRHLLERQSKIIVLLVSYDQPIGQYKFTSSVKFFQEWLKTQIDCPVYFNDAIIENFDEQLENQNFQENSVLVLENLFFYPDETGNYIEDPDIEARTPFRSLLPYGQIYIQGDRVNFFHKFYSSIVHLTSEQSIISNMISKDLSTLCYNIQGCFNKNGTIIIGGDLSGNKLLAIDQLSGHVSTIILMGNIGLAFYLTMYDIKSDLINTSVRNVILNLLQTMKEESKEAPPQRLTRISHISEQLKPRARIICPQDFLITQLPQDYNPANEEHVQIVISSVKPYVPEQSLILEPGYVLLDFGPNTISNIEQEILESQRLIWIDDANLNLINIEKQITVPDIEAIALLKRLKEEEAQRELERQEKIKEQKKKGIKTKIKEEAPKEEINIKTTKEINVPVFNETNRALGKLIYELNQQKKDRHIHSQREGSFPNYNFDQDLVVTIVGQALEKKLNSEDFQKVEQSIVEKPEQSVKESNQEDQQEIDGEENQLEQVEEKAKANQVKLISDYFIQDQEFLLTFLAGTNVHCTHYDEYPPKPESEINEEQYFEDED